MNRVYLKDAQGNPRSPITNMKTVFNDNNKNLNDIIEDIKGDMYSLSLMHEYSFIVSDSADMHEWLYNQKDGVSYASILIMPGVYELNQPANLTKAETYKIQGLMVDDKVPEIIFHNCERGFYYEKNMYGDIRVSISNVHVKMSYKKYNTGVPVYAMSNMRLINNCKVSTYNQGNTKAYKTTIFSCCRKIDSCAVEIIDDNPDINPKNEYQVFEMCKYEDADIQHHINNGFGRVEK